MPYDPAPGWNPEKQDPPNMLERFMERAVKDITLQGEMFRLLMDSELWVIVHAFSITPGANEFSSENPPQICQFSDRSGNFIPVFSSYQAADAKAGNLPDKESRALAGMSASILFLLLKGSEDPIRIITPKVEITLPGEAVADLLDGKYTNSQPGTHPPRELLLAPVDEEELPPDLADGIRDFCERTPGALGIYVFREIDRESGEPVMGNLHVFLTLRGTHGTFYNDFTLMAPKLAPDHLLLFSVVRPEEKHSLAFLAQNTPVWPVF